LQYYIPLLLALSSALMAQPAALTTLEQEFKDSLTGALMEGQSSRDGKTTVSPDKYNIEKVEKTGGDNWTFFVKLAFRGQETIAPIPLEVKWAGDTPVIMVTDKGFPGMGTYTARVVVYRGHYAGTWSGKNGGGKVWGTVAKKAPAPVTTGRWVGTVSYGDLKVPFSMDLQFDGGARAAFLNGDQRTASINGAWKDGLFLEFPQGRKLETKLDSGQLKGTFDGYAIEAGPYCTCAYEGEAGPDITGEWKLEGSDKKLTVTRKGEDTFATLESAVHAGRFDGLQFNLAHFDGERASVLEATVRKDGGLDLTWKQPGQQTTLRASRNGR
jgi:hypothetical protein